MSKRDSSEHWSSTGARAAHPLVDADNLEHAALLRAADSSMREITAKTGLNRTTLYRHLTPRSPAAVIAGG
ncbi:hypothetical protein [Arthrobacter sp. MMS18-M83]|uniref:hypothetical protein n=1 Tax=Arthrobacter sp. MMS18-M83 TaxID=2996261 RepID=UPI00227AA1BF|nr:hypothetical protein [Arthrobacter sp. MMS18-M83]WAH99734.1 hypothetical protein OW521_24030 [Arthrobacter sp. MMS18-M83]